MFILSIIAIIVYNYKNPDQNVINYRGSKNIPVDSDAFLNSIKNNTESYIYSLAYNEFAKLYNEVFEENSWQRYALNEERGSYAFENIFSDYNQDIMEYLINIKDYEYNPNTQTTLEIYETSKTKFNKYVEALKSNDWKNFVNLKIKNLEERKNTQTLLPEEIKEIDFEIDWYYLRLNNNIVYNDNIINQYLTEYKENYYSIIYKESHIDESSQADINEFNNNKARLELCKYAIENHINYDMSDEYNLILINKIDARISLIRTFSHFNIILIIITIYISSTTITEEITKKTIKSVLTKPHKRSTIIMSKAIACMITIIISMIFIGIVQFFVGGFIFGFDSYANGYIGYDYNNDKVFTMSSLSYLIISGFTKIPEYIIISLFCIFIGIFNKNIAMSMILTLIICIFANSALAEWSKVDALSKITRYFITNNWDFSTYLFGNISNVNGVNLWHSLLIFLIYLTLLEKITISKFKKLEV